MRCAGVLLTGGTSRRLGADKARAEIAGVSLAERAAGVLAAVCELVVEVGDGVSGLHAVREDPPGSGPLAGLVAGAAALAGPAGDGRLVDAVVLLGCDLVRVDAPLVAMLAAWPGRASVVPVAAGRPQYACARYGPRALDAARVLLAAGERSLRALATARDVVYVGEDVWLAVARAGADCFADVDTPSDAARLGVTLPPHA